MNMSKHKAVILIVLSLVFVAAAIAVISSYWDEKSSAPAATAATIGDKRWLAVAPGRVEPKSGTIRIATPVVGLVGRVLVKPNDTVFAGEPLIQLRDDELQARLAAAEALAAARWRARNEQSSSGKADQRRKAEDAVARAERSVFDAQAAVDKAAATWRASGEPDASLTAARSELARAQNDFTARLAQLRKTAADDPIPTSLDAQFTAARADVAVARAALEKTMLRAPADGTVLQVNIKAGELTAPSASQPLLLLANLSALRVRAEVDERDIAGIKVGQSVSVRAAAFPGREFAGRVSSIAPLVEPAHLDSRGQANRSDVDVVEVLIDLAQPGPLAVGMKVDVYFGQENSSAK
jgi:HlyD family secretion protein